MADIYEYKFQDKLNGDWKRLRFLKPDGSTKIESPVIEYLPYGSINLGKYKYAFDKRPIGLPLAPTQQITIDLQLCPTEFNSWFFNSSYTLNNQYFNVYFELSYASSENGVYSKFFVGSLKRGVEIEYPLDYDRITIDFVDLIKIGLDNVNFNDFEFTGGNLVAKVLAYYKIWNDIEVKYYLFPKYDHEFAYTLMMGNLSYLYSYINDKLNNYLSIASRGYYPEIFIDPPNIDYFKNRIDWGTLVNYYDKIEFSDRKVIALHSKLIGDIYANIGGVYYKTSPKVKDDYADHPEALGNYKCAWDLINDLYRSDGAISEIRGGLREIAIYREYNHIAVLTKGSFKSTPKLLLNSNITSKITISLSDKIGDDNDSFDYTLETLNNNDSSESITEVFSNVLPINASGLSFFRKNNLRIYEDYDAIRLRGIYYYDNDNNEYCLANPVCRKEFFNGSIIDLPILPETSDKSTVLQAYQDNLWSIENKDDMVFRANEFQNLAKTNVIGNGLLNIFGDKDNCKISGAISLKEYYDYFMANQAQNFTYFKYDISNVYNLPETQNIPPTWIVKSYEIDWNSGMVEIEAFSFKGAE